MKKFLLFLFICSGFLSKAQVYNNEWIDYNKTYYKFKVGSNGVYRISQPVLNSLGIGNTPAQDFQLWRNGQEVSIYTSISSGPLSATDYIEFWGEMNDGKPDKPLYRDQNDQLNDHWSLQTDTVYYFLTVNPGAANKRLVNTINNVAGNTLSPEPYFMHTLGNYFREKISWGYATLVGDAYVYSSAYDKGEGWVSNDIVTERPADPVNNLPYIPPVILSASHYNLHAAATGPSPSIKLNAAGNALHPRSFITKLNGNIAADKIMDYFDYLKIDTSFYLSYITGDSIQVQVINQSAVPLDRMVVAQYEITYPRQFHFDNLKNFVFQLPANPAGNYLEITNFSYSMAPVLYDITNGKRYVTDISNPSMIKVVLQPSLTARTLVLVSEDAININSVTSLETRNFINYNLASNQGNYLIISHPLLYSGPNGSNPVEEYRMYRSSVAGGSYSAKVYDINQLVDQFAFGIKKHPLSIRNFIQYARANYPSAPKNVFLLGKGVNYLEYRTYENYPSATVQSALEKLNLVPTFGFPASDNLLSCFNGDNIPTVPVGRLSVINGDEVATYLKKVKDYEMAQALYSCVIADKGWMKNVVHVVGADDGVLQNILDGMMTNYKRIISDTFFGGNVSTFSKTTSDAVQELNSTRLQQLFEEGLSLILYFGHSSASTLEFNLDDPMNYNNAGKYPVFVTLGCNAGNLYNFNQNRFLTKESISEKFVLAPDRGSIAFLATTSLGIVQYLDVVNLNNYKAIGVTKYGGTLGEIMEETIRRTFSQQSQFDYYARVHCEQISLNGDPAIRYNTHPKPDYVIESPLIQISPEFISVAETNFKVKAKIMNIGKAINKDIVVQVKRTYPNNVSEVIFRDTIPGIRYMDSITLTIPIIASRDKGLNKLEFMIDANLAVDEICETNNTLVKEIFIYEDEARPVYPYNFAIINKQNIKLVASTANPFASSKLYRMELDTTEFFNSPFKVTKSLTQVGGVLEFTPGITFTDSTVYYWRVAPIPSTGQPKWNTSSFVYLQNSALGFNQSHFFQHLKSSGERITLDSASRLWDYDSITNNLFIRNAVFPTAATQQADFTVAVNDVAFIGSGCFYDEIIINVFDARTFKPWYNNYSLYPDAGLSNSLYPQCGDRKIHNFEYLLSNSTSRAHAMHFLDSIPTGSYVVIRGNVNPDDANNTYPSAGPVGNRWISDTTLYGSGNSLYHRLYNQGFTAIDSFNRARTWLFVYKKNEQAHFQPQYVLSEGNFDKITLSVNPITPDSLGFITSPVFGPAKEWKELRWSGTSKDTAAGDNPTISIYGINDFGNETLLYENINTSMPVLDISDIDAAIYPYVQLKMRNVDSIFFTPYQLKYWRLTYLPVPEGAIAPNVLFTMKDTVEIGEPIDFKIAFKNISEAAFDSVKVKMVITDRNNVSTNITSRLKPLPLQNDTLSVGLAIDSRNFPGLNTLFVNFNPDFDQREQYLFNNFGYKSFYVRPDSLNPLMDVTFDGVHILNRDIVSSKPQIIVKLKDEAKWLALTDTSLFTLKVKFPDGSMHRYYFTNDTLKFIPAAGAPTNDNLATLEFNPYFAKDGEYELIVTGKDVSNNKAGGMEYKVAFQVINKAMISNMLNYPNPFTTSTAFVFTITGNEIPQNIKIEILTITGKIVREITKDELGPLHIGRNITEFKWDGTDQYGQKLANGIYLYRVVTNLNGKSLDKYRADGDDTDKYFNKGYGKMYLMR